MTHTKTATGSRLKKIETPATPAKSQAQMIEAARTEYMAAANRVREAYLAAVRKETVGINPSGSMRPMSLTSLDGQAYRAKLDKLKAIYDGQVSKLKAAYLEEIERIQNAGVIDPSPIAGAVHIADPNSTALMEQIKAAQSLKPAQMGPGIRLGQ